MATIIRAAGREWLQYLFSNFQEHTVKLNDFVYDLPDALIARHPPQRRSDSRLMVLPRQQGAPSHRQFLELPDLLQPGDLLVVNNTRVIPARMRGNKETGGAVELLLERIVDEQHFVAQLRASKAPTAGTRIILQGGDTGSAGLTVKGREEAFFVLKADCPVTELLHEFGEVPLPPYMERKPQAQDIERYQTVYASREGAVAAPTAGLHFDEAMLSRLAGMGIERTEVTLHVGAGTFQPVRVDDVRAHKMHAEWCEVNEGVVSAIKACRERGGRVIAVGTTVVRSLESAAVSSASQGNDVLRPFSGNTDIFIYPGYDFRVIDGLITNFHLPRSTLLMLISALAGRQRVLHAYEQAVRECYRFFSYGDAMLIL